jgi:hypothetical protein
VEPKRATLDEPKRQTLDDELGLISEAEYAAFVGKTIPSVRNDRSAGKGPPFVRMFGKVKYPRAGVKAFVAKHTVTPVAAPTMIDARRPLRRRARRHSAT